MSILKEVVSLKLKVTETEDSLTKVLKIIISSWIDECCDLDTRNINLLVVKDFNELDPILKGKEPFLYLYPKRRAFKVSRPKIGFENPISLFEPEMKYKRLKLKDRKDIVLQQISDLIAEQKEYIDQKRAEYYVRHPKPILGPGEGWWRAFEVEFDTAHENPFFCISFSGYETPA